MTLVINGTPVPAEGLVFVYDGCHKIYLVTNEEGRQRLLAKGWTADDFRHPSELPFVWKQTCSLRFISDADLDTQYVEQCEDATVVWEGS